MTLEDSKDVIDIEHNEHIMKPREVGNSSPLGLFAFGSTTFIYAMYLLQVGNITNSHAGLGAALFYGGLVQLLAAMWEIYSGKTFAATVSCSYGAFWISFGFIYLPGSGIIDSYNGDQAMLGKAVGVYLVAWTTTYIASLTFIFVIIEFIALDIANFTGVEAWTRVGGSFGVACGAWYMGLAQLLTKELTYFTLPSFSSAPA
ncbi:3377_t:CDS:2 [Cetraspora pellucida]|uniref:3377_t:CDS:1 n=1 Tax=Cetraspora pellucida TaxID=1433469 RepID=A0A9N9NS32_9GLOM|nr:3377_t:CDS:2 [Cetraspora pellucida]